MGETCEKFPAPLGGQGDGDSSECERSLLGDFLAHLCRTELKLMAVTGSKPVANPPAPAIGPRRLMGTMSGTNVRHFHGPLTILPQTYISLALNEIRNLHRLSPCFCENNVPAVAEDTG